MQRGQRRRPALRTIAVTTGEPAGVGPDLCTDLAAAAPAGCRLVLIGDRSLFGRAHGRRSRPPALPDFDPAARPRAGAELLHVPLAQPAVPGRLDPANARYVLDTLDAAIGGCAAGAFDGIVTAPVQKSVINDAGIRFTGHTEYLAAQTGVATPVMLLAGGGLRVALATTHVPLRKVSRALTPERLATVLRIVDADLRSLFGLRKPRILVLGLNPHAGENGHLGSEEGAVIEPVTRELRRAGLDLVGPGAGRHRLPAAPAQGHRRRRRDVSRPGAAGAEVRELRPCRQRHARPADPAHVGRPRHGTRPRRHPPRRPGQPAGGARAGARAQPARAVGPRTGETGLRQEALRPALPARPGHDRADRARDRRRSPASGWSKSGRAAARSRPRCWRRPARST